MADPHFIGLVQALRSSAEAALGERHSPMITRLARDGILARQTATKSLNLLQMLARKSYGNLEPTEREALHQAIAAVEQWLAEAGTADDPKAAN
jgi:hypothetical protein